MRHTDFTTFILQWELGHGRSMALVHVFHITNNKVFLRNWGLLSCTQSSIWESLPPRNQQQTTIAQEDCLCLKCRTRKLTVKPIYCSNRLIVWFLSFFFLALAEKFADIFFLVDSGVPQQDFQQVRTILTRLANQMKVGANAHHVGLAQYGTDVKTEFNLTTYKTKEDILSAIKRFRPRRQQPADPRNLGVALNHASKYFFTSEAGGRADEGYRQYLIIFSGKESDDDFKREARLIKSTGVTVIGMSLSSSLRGMNVIASEGRWYESTVNGVQNLKAIFEKQEIKKEASRGKILLFIFLCSFLIISAIQRTF